MTPLWKALLDPQGFRQPLEDYAAAIYLFCGVPRKWQADWLTVQRRPV